MRAEIALVVGDDAVPALIDQGLSILRRFDGVDDATVSGRRYAADKWTVKEVLGHLIDDERVFAYRCLCISRGEPQPLSGFDQDAYQLAIRYEQRGLASLLAEFRHARESTLLTLWTLTAEEWQRSGWAAGYHASVRGLAYHIVAHASRHERSRVEQYHMEAISLTTPATPSAAQRAE